MIGGEAGSYDEYQEKAARVVRQWPLLPTKRRRCYRSSPRQCIRAGLPGRYYLPASVKYSQPPVCSSPPKLPKPAIIGYIRLVNPNQL